MMNAKTTYSFACAAFAAVVAAGSLAGCFSERVEVTAPTGQELCVGVQPANVVRIQDFAFSPSQVTVSAGQTVTFVNCGQAQHTSTEDTDDWDSGLMAQYQTFEVTPAAGTHPYHCEPHPFMQGTIIAN